MPSMMPLGTYECSEETSMGTHAHGPPHWKTCYEGASAGNCITAPPPNYHSVGQPGSRWDSPQRRPQTAKATRNPHDRTQPQSDAQKGHSSTRNTPRRATKLPKPQHKGKSRARNPGNKSTSWWARATWPKTCEQKVKLHTIQANKIQHAHRLR